MKRIVWAIAAICVVGAAAFFTFTRPSEERFLTFGGLGPVNLGMTVPEAEVALGAKLSPMNPANEIHTEAC